MENVIDLTRAPSGFTGIARGPPGRGSKQNKRLKNIGKRNRFDTCAFGIHWDRPGPLGARERRRWWPGLHPANVYIIGGRDQYKEGIRDKH